MLKARKWLNFPVTNTVNSQFTSALVRSATARSSVVFTHTVYLLTVAAILSVVWAGVTNRVVCCTLSDFQLHYVFDETRWSSWSLIQYSLHVLIETRVFNFTTTGFVQCYLVCERNASFWRYWFVHRTMRDVSLMKHYADEFLHWILGVFLRFDNNVCDRPNFA